MLWIRPPNFLIVKLIFPTSGPASPRFLQVWAKIDCNVYVTSYCDGLWHTRCNIFGFCNLCIKYLKNATLQGCLAFQVSVLERLENVNFIQLHKLDTLNKSSYYFSLICYGGNKTSLRSIHFDNYEKCFKQYFGIFETHNWKVSILFCACWVLQNPKIKCKLFYCGSQKCQTMTASIFPSYINLCSKNNIGFHQKNQEKTII